MSKSRMRALQRRYGKKKARSLAKPSRYQVVVREGSAAPRPLRGMRLFESKREAAEALRMLAPYQDENTRMSLKVRR